MYEDFINAGLLSPNAEREAALMGLFALGNQIGNRSAPRLSPTPPPMDLNAVMSVYQNQMNAALRRGAMRKQMQDQEKLRKLFEPTPINEPAAQAIADARFNQVQSGTMDVDEMDADIDARASAAREAALPAARQMTTTPVALQGLPANLARVIGGIGQVDPEMGAKTLASVLTKSGTGAASPAAVREFEFYQSLNPEQQQQFLMVKRATQNLNLGDRIVTLNPRTPGGTPLGRRDIGVSPDAQPEVRGQQAEQSAVGTGRGQAKKMLIEGTPEFTKEDGRIRSLQSAFNDLGRLNNRRNEQIAVAIDILEKEGNLAAGLGSLSTAIPGTPARRLAAALDAIKANIGFEELKAMKAASPTGGALGQVTVREIEFLQATMDSLDQGLNPEVLIKNLKNIQRRANQTAQTARNGLQKTLNASPLYKQRQNRTQRPTNTTQGRPIPADVLREARAAIKKKAPREDVLRRLQEQGFDIRGVNL